MDTATALCDIKGFYDHVQLPRLFEEAMKWHYPLQLFALNIGLSLGTRFLQWATWAAEGLDARRSLLTGERHSNHLSRVAVYSIIEHVVWAIPRSIGGLWVDDFSLRIYGTNRLILPDMTRAVHLIHSLLGQAGFILASKTKLTTSELRAAATVVAQLADRGIHISTGPESPDLGLDTGGGSRRARAKHVSRYNLSFKKVKRIMTIKKGRGDTVAASLWKASAWAQGAYAAQAIGLTKTELRRLRTSAAKAIDGGEKVRCATTLFAIRDKLANDPAVKQPVDQVHQWIKAWCEDSQLRDLTMRAWPIVHERLLAAPVHQRWRHCKGPIAAIQTTLLNLGWDIPRADWWCDRTGQVWQAPLHDLKLVKHDHALFLKAVAAAAEAGLWKEATSFRRGAGLEAGCYYQHAASLYRRLLKKGNPLKAGAVLAVATAATWPMEERQAAGLSDSATCCRCGHHPESWLHQTWTCKSNESMDSFKRIKHLKQQAVDTATTHACLWARGLIPMDRIAIPEPLPSASLEAWGLDPDMTFKPKGSWRGWSVIATDASGGPWASDPLHRRVGASLVQADVAGRRPIAAIDFKLAGDDPQEVGLGELMCLLLHLGHSTGNVVMVTDRQSVWDGWTAKVWEHLDSRTTYPAVWREIGALAAGLDRIVHVVKVESHCDDDEVRQGFTSGTLRALNDMADERAGARATAIAVAADTVAANRRIQGLATGILEHAAEAMVQAKLASPPLARVAKERHLVKAPQACMEAGHSCPRGYRGGCWPDAPASPASSASPSRTS